MSECKRNCQVEPGIISDTLVNDLYSLKFGAELPCCADFIIEL